MGPGTKPPNPIVQPRESILIVNLNQMIDPRYQNDVARNRVVRSVVPSPTDPANTDSIIQSIAMAVQDHVEKHGTLSELRLYGHASSALMTFGEASFFSSEYQYLNIGEMLNAIHGVQSKLGVKVAEKIEFAGCHVFTNLSPEWANYLRKQSVIMGVELIGTTDYMAINRFTGAAYNRTISFRDGQVGEFTPSEGGALTSVLLMPNKILRSSLAAAVDAAIVIGVGAAQPILMAKGTYSDQIGRLGNAFANQLLGTDTPHSTWLECHRGRSQEDGKACQDKHEAHRLAVQESIAVSMGLAPNIDKPVPGASRDSKQR